MEYIKAYNGAQIPRIIYKFFPLDNNFYNGILNNYLWFSDPTSFNDPYDCNLDFSMNFTRDDLITYLREIQVENRTKGSREYNDREIFQRLKDFDNNPEDFKQTIRSNNRKLVAENYGVSCFSEKNDNILMWSHYADKHKGICLGFDIKKDKDFFKWSFKVDYPKTYPQIDIIKDRKKEKIKLIQFQLATKSKDWNYEKEIRVILPRELAPKYRGSVKFKKPSIVEVYFGYKTDSATIQNLTELFTQIDYHVDFIKFNLKSNEFGLEQTKI